MFKTTGKNVWIIFLLIILFSIDASSQRRRSSKKYKQRFSFVQKAEIGRTQIDGDNLRGYSKPSFGIGSAVNYRMTEHNYLRIGINYSIAGSREPNPVTLLTLNRTAVEMDLKIIGSELGWYYVPGNSSYFLFSLSYNNIFSYDYNLVLANDDVFETANFDDSIKRSYIGVNFYYGYKFPKQFSIYAKINVTATSLLESQYASLITLRPYGIALGVAYHLIP